MTKTVILMLSVALLMSCSSGNEKPQDVLPVSTMKTIIWDMSLADNMASAKYALKRDSQRIMVTGLYNKIFTLHKIDKTTFYKSLDYYEANPVAMQMLYDSVNAYGTRQKAKVYQTGL